MLFPHHRGAPYKNSLKWLVSKFLAIDIRVGDASLGHDSCEDASAALRLAMLKLQNGTDFGLPSQPSKVRASFPRASCRSTNTHTLTHSVIFTHTRRSQLMLLSSPLLLFTHTHTKVSVLATLSASRIRTAMVARPEVLQKFATRKGLSTDAVAANSAADVVKSIARLVQPSSVASGRAPKYLLAVLPARHTIDGRSSSSSSGEAAEVAAAGDAAGEGAAEKKVLTFVWTIYPYFVTAFLAYFIIDY